MADESIKIFSARACAAPLEAAAALFTRDTGIQVDISVCARHCATQNAEEADAEAGMHDFLVEIDEYGVHDLAIGGAEYLLDDGEVRQIILKGKRCLIAYRESAIVVPKGNPVGIGSLADLTRDGIRVGVSVIDCLKGLWEDVSGQVGLTAEIRENISFYASGCIAIVEAVAEGIVDAAFGWTTFGRLDERLEVIRLPEAQRVYRGTGVGMLKFCKETERAQKFMDFLLTPKARACYEKFGWVLPATLRG
jgi:accessory colonization factor AcfC